jgi:hypothetical protein
VPNFVPRKVETTTTNYETVQGQLRPSAIVCYHVDFTHLYRRYTSLPECAHLLWFVMEMGHKIGHSLNFAANVLHAVADLLLVNIQSDVIHRSHEGLLGVSESADR